MAIVTGGPSRGVARACRVRIATLLGLAVWLVAGCSARPAEAVEFGCRIGKPAYCFKYGEMFCLKESSRPDRQQACVDWTSACLACHARIPECLGGERPPHKSPLCARCQAEWHGCMHEIDKLYWPNRRGKSSNTTAPEAAPEAVPQPPPSQSGPATVPPAEPAERANGPERG